MALTQTPRRRRVGDAEKKPKASIRRSEFNRIWPAVALPATEIVQSTRARGEVQHGQFVQRANTIAIRDEINLACSGLHQRTLDVLADMYGADKCYGTEIHGPITINKNIGISIEQGARMHKLMRSYSVKRSLEVGFAYGFSTVWMLDALQSRSNAFHVAIDPWEKHTFHGIGLAQVKRLGFGVRFEWIENFSIHALSDLIRERAEFDFIFIDGNHRFDDVIVNFYLSDQILQPGGLVVFDDMWLNSVRTATNFILNNRSYEVVPQPFENMLVLRKTRYDNRDSTHFNSFEILGPSKISEPPPPRSSTISNGIMRVRRVLGKISRPGGR